MQNSNLMIKEFLPLIKKVLWKVMKANGLIANFMVRVFLNGKMDQFMNIEDNHLSYLLIWTSTILKTRHCVRRVWLILAFSQIWRRMSSSKLRSVSLSTSPIIACNASFTISWMRRRVELPVHGEDLHLVDEHPRAVDMHTQAVADWWRQTM